MKKASFFVMTFVVVGLTFVQAQNIQKLELEVNQTYYCDGIYKYSDEPGAEDAKYFELSLNNLNRNNFGIEFEFLVGENRDHWAIMLSSGWRILGFALNDDGSTLITTNNQRNYYSLKATYKLNTWHKVKIICQDKLLYVLFDNNPTENIVIEINTVDGDNELSSINYSNGTAFNGYLRNIKVFM